MTENDILFFLILLCITVIPISLWFCLIMTKEADDIIRRCHDIGEWAKKELEQESD